MNTFDEIDRMFREMDRLFDEMRTTWWNGHATPGFDAARPALESPTALEGSGGDTAVSLEDEGDAYVFVMDLPGFEKEDIDLVFDDGVLSVRAHGDLEEDADGLRTMRSRRVSRRVSIPKAVVIEEISATYRNGVLEVSLPIVEEEREDRGHRIDIE